jgi:hypothetical protein
VARQRQRREDGQNMAGRIAGTRQPRLGNLDVLIGLDDNVAVNVGVMISLFDNIVLDMMSSSGCMITWMLSSRWVVISSFSMDDHVRC